MLEDITGQEIKEQFKSNSKLRIITMVVGGLIVLVLGYFAYMQFMWNPDNEKSMEGNYVGLNYAAADSTDLAIEELNIHKNKFDGKIGGEVSQFVLARQYMAKGDFAKAITELDGVDVSDTYVAAMRLGLKADCLSEQKKYEEAANLYLEAAEVNANDMTSPMYLKKAGFVAEELNDYEMATTCWKKIKSDYPAYASQMSIDKYISRAENQMAK